MYRNCIDIRSQHDAIFYMKNKSCHIDISILLTTSIFSCITHNNLLHIRPGYIFLSSTHIKSY